MNLPTNITTTAESIKFLDTLENFKSTLYSNKISRDEVSPLILSLFEENSVSLDDVDKANSFLDQAITLLKTLSVFSITLAYIPSYEDLKKFSQFIQSTANTAVLLDLKYNPTILGGSIIEYKGRYGDYSLLKKVCLKTI